MARSFSAEHYRRDGRGWELGIGESQMYTSSVFDRSSKHVARKTGDPIVFMYAVLAVCIWLASGPVFNFSDTWQLVINTGTTIITFLMVFLIQNTQNRDSEAMQLKLDELIRVVEGAHNSLLDLEELSAEELEVIKKRYERLAEKARKQLRKGYSDTHRSNVRIP
jgi:low affinity Fe/Cu permease